MADYYYNSDGTEVAVLVSPGWGAGWSTWNDEALAYDKRVVQFWLDHVGCKDNDAKEFFESLGYEDIYFGGFNDIVLKWVPVGNRWRIEEYDGYESLEILSMENYNYVPAKGE